MSLHDEFKFYLENQDELVREYRGQYVVIKGGKVLGSYPDPVQAVTETQKTHELGTFLVQRAEPGSDAHTQVFRSRVA